ncbi:MAG: 2-oxo acid dehydrogenase subunit E2 [Armatimonadetes bacterium]|nr:2-oxo acid dehydrogenase subunit E2 [Armatimonadota bacterium]
MAIVSVHIPAIGEGLQEARLVATLKNPGDRVRRDEPIYQMETDKAVMDVESPYEGVIVEWLAPVDTVMPIGAEIAKMEVVEAGEAPAAAPAPAASGSAQAGEEVPLMIPAIGEGLQEARLVATLKNPGDTIKRDEPIYQMETDKAVMDVESPYDGVLVSWSAPIDTVLPIGGQVGVVRLTSAAATAAPVAHAPAAPASAPAAAAPSTAARPAASHDLRAIPPRTRAYAKEKGIDEATLVTLPAAGSKLMPEDVDAYLAGGSASTAAPTKGQGYTDTPVSSKQRVLNSRMVRGNELVVPGTISVAVNWEPIEALRAEVKAKGGDFQPSTFTMFAYCVSRVLEKYPQFRTAMRGDDTYRTYDHANLGIAVALEGGELVIAVVEKSDALSFREFADEARAKIDLARSGKDQANETVTISLTNMQNYGLRDAVPVVVPPSVATLFIGEVYNGLRQNTSELHLQRTCNLGLTFDHRVLNGAAAANFMADIKSTVEAVRTLITL